MPSEDNKKKKTPKGPPLYDFRKVCFLNVGGLFPSNKDLTVKCKVKTPRFNKKSCDYALLLPQPFQDLNQAYNIANVKKKNYAKGVLELCFKVKKRTKDYPINRKLVVVYVDGKSNIAQNRSEPFVFNDNIAGGQQIIDDQSIENDLEHFNNTSELEDICHNLQKIEDHAKEFDLFKDDKSILQLSEKLDMWKYKIEGLIRKIESQQNYSALYGNQQPYRHGTNYSERPEVQTNPDDFTSEANSQVFNRLASLKNSTLDFLMEKSKHRIQYSYLQIYAPYSDDSKVVKKVDPKEEQIVVQDIGGEGWKADLHKLFTGMDTEELLENYEFVQKHEKRINIYYGIVGFVIFIILGLLVWCGYMYFS